MIDSALRPTLNVYRVLAENIACGLDPQKVALYCQSHVYETTELYLYLNMLAYKGELEKTATFKEKVRLQPQNVNAGLLTYPVLQAADILLHRASLVPVGKDQEQHLEMSRMVEGLDEAQRQARRAQGEAEWMWYWSTGSWSPASSRQLF